VIRKTKSQFNTGEVGLGALPKVSLFCVSLSMHFYEERDGSLYEWPDFIRCS
jgi:hypothetical protein